MYPSQCWFVCTKKRLAGSLPNGPALFTPCTPNINGCAASGQRLTGLAQFNASFSVPSSLDAYSIRLDHVINAKFTVFGRYNYSPSSVVSRGAFPPPLTVLNTVEPLSSSVQTATVGLTQMITPRISNEAKANYSNDRVGTKLILDNFGGAVPLPDSLIALQVRLKSSGTFGSTGSTIRNGPSRHRRTPTRIRRQNSKP